MPSNVNEIPFCRLLGMEQETIAEGHSRSMVPLRLEHLNSNNVAHGGLTFSLADTCMGSAVRSTLKDDERCVTVEMKINYLLPGAGTSLHSESKVVHKGKSLVTTETRIWAEKALVATASGTFAIRRAVR